MGDGHLWSAKVYNCLEELERGGECVKFVPEQWHKNAE